MKGTDYKSVPAMGEWDAFETGWLVADQVKDGLKRGKVRNQVCLPG